MKRKPVKPVLPKTVEPRKLSDLPEGKEKDELMKAIEPESRTVGSYPSTHSVNLVKSRTSQPDYKSENLKINKELLSAQTAISQLQESITLKDAEISVYKEQHEILESELVDAKNKIELFAKHLGESETELLHLKNTYSELSKSFSVIESENKQLRTDKSKLANLNSEIYAELISIKQKWYYRWFS